MIKLLKELMNRENIDGYIVPKNDEFFSEYSFPNRLKLISNFFKGGFNLTKLLSKV